MFVAPYILPPDPDSIEAAIEASAEEPSPLFRQNEDDYPSTALEIATECAPNPWFYAVDRGLPSRTSAARALTATWKTFEAECDRLAKEARP